MTAKKAFSLKQIKRELRDLHSGKIPETEFIMHREVDDEIERLWELAYILVGETRQPTWDESEFLPFATLGFLGTLDIQLSYRSGPIWKYATSTLRSFLSKI